MFFSCHWSCTTYTHPQFRLRHRNKGGSKGGKGPPPPLNENSAPLWPQKIPMNLAVLCSNEVKVTRYCAKVTFVYFLLVEKKKEKFFTFTCNEVKFWRNFSTFTPLHFRLTDKSKSTNTVLWVYDYHRRSGQLAINHITVEADSEMLCIQCLSTGCGQHRREIR